jgi:hypothetical protein
MASPTKSSKSVPKAQLFMRLKVKTGKVSEISGKPAHKSVYCMKQIELNNVVSESNEMVQRLVPKIQELFT